MSSIQVENGNRDEKSLCLDYLRARKWYAYNTKRSASGSQPVDVLAFKGTKDGTSVVLFLDAKNQEKGKSFPFSRIEQNQETSMLFCSRYCGNNPDHMGFVVFFSVGGEKEAMFLSYPKYRELMESGAKSAPMDEMVRFDSFLDGLDRKYFAEKDK